MKKTDRVRKGVSEFYARSVKKGCGCGKSPGPVLPKGVAAHLAGYTGDELKNLPDEAVVNSFGCGNPLAFSEVKPGETVLDLGSGAGIDLLIAAGKVGPEGRVIGVDMTGDMIDKARKNIKASGAKNIVVKKGIIEKLPVDDASVDWVISNCVINLSPEKERVFSEIARVLKPGGRISISDIVAEDLPEFVKNSAAMYGSCVAGAIPEKEYLAGLRKAGLTGVAVKERLVYDMAQLRAFFGPDALSEAGGCCGGGGIPKDIADEITGSLEGKVWSAKVTGRKPAGKSRKKVSRDTDARRGTSSRAIRGP